LAWRRGVDDNDETVSSLGLRHSVVAGEEAALTTTEKQTPGRHALSGVLYCMMLRIRAAAIIGDSKRKARPEFHGPAPPRLVFIMAYFLLPPILGSGFSWRELAFGINAGQVDMAWVLIRGAFAPSSSNWNGAAVFARQKQPYMSTNCQKLAILRFLRQGGIARHVFLAL
jgi:hypothetical protein